MTDPELIKKKLAHIETCVEELRTLAQPDRIAADIREQRFVEHKLQIAIQSMLDVASHIVSDERLGEPRMGFRNILVHGYETVDLAIVREVVETRLGDLLEFVGAIRPKLP